MPKKLAYIITVLIFHFAGTPVQSEVKIAVVPGGDPKPVELLVLTEAKLFEQKELALLERTEIDKVLAEQNLSALFDAASAVKLGQILKADLFAVLETTSIVIFDAKTGLRFVDDTLPVALDGAVKAAVDAVKTAVEKKLKLADGELVTFGVLGVRNIDFPVVRDAWCRAVAGMLERSLLYRGGAVLERSRLQLVNKERQLTGDAENDLLASMKLIDLDFTRTQNLQSFNLTAQIGKETFSTEGSLDKPFDAVQKIAEQLLESKAVEKNETEAARQAEAARFANEAVFLKKIGNEDEAIEKIEIAIALEPEEITHRRWLDSWLSEKIEFRLRYWDGLNGYEHAWLQNPIGAETMRKVVQDALRLEVVKESLAGEPLPSGRSAGFPYYVDYRYTYNFSDIRKKLTAIATHKHPNFKEEIRALNRRYLERWRVECRVGMERIADKETFQQFLSKLVFPVPQEPIDLVAPSSEIVEKILRLSQEYEVQFSIEPMIHSSMNRVLWGYGKIVSEYRLENKPGTNRTADAIIERTLVLMDKSPQLMARIHAWLIRNRPNVTNVSITQFGLDANPERLAAYRKKLISYISTLPKEMSVSDSDILYNDLMRIYDIQQGHRSLEDRLTSATFQQLSEVITLADSRKAFNMWAIQDYIQLADAAIKNDKTDYLKWKKQLDPVVLRQLALAEHLAKTNPHTELALNIERTRKRATEAGITETPVPAMKKVVTLQRPWTSEVNLFPEKEGYRCDGAPTLCGNLLFCTLQGNDAQWLGCVNLDTLEKRYIPFPIGKWDSCNLTYIDKENAYFNTTSPESHAWVDENGQHCYTWVGLGLLVYPLDESESWMLSTDDGLPDNRVHVFGRLGDQCYAKVGTDWIIRIDLKTRQWEQLSSSRAKEGKTPFVNGKQLQYYDALYDPKRERILLHDKTEGVDRREAFWAIEKDGTFVPLHNGNPSHIVNDLVGVGHKLFERLDEGVQFLQFGAWNGDKYIYDPETSTVYATNFGVYSGCIWNGYFWGGGGGVLFHEEHGFAKVESKWWRRRIGAESEYEHLVTPEMATPFESGEPWYPTFLIPTPDDKRLIVGKYGELILLRFEEPSTSPQVRLMPILDGTKK